MKNIAYRGCAEPMEEDAWEPSAAGHVPFGTVGSNHFKSEEPPYVAVKGLLKIQERIGDHTL